MNEFAQLALNEHLVDNVSGMGYTEPTPVQTAVIPLLLNGEDIFAQSQTGSGKTAAFALPILQQLVPNQGYVQCLVLSPTRELAIQVADAFQEYSKGGNFSVLPVYGGQAYSRQINKLRSGVDIVVGTPGRLLDLIKKKALILDAVKIVVLDEADEMLSMGFIEDIRSILKNVPQERQTALFSATLPKAIRQLGSQYMNNPQTVQIERKHLTVDSVDQRYYLANNKQKFAALTRIFEVEDVEKALVFAATKRSTEQLSSQLKARGFKAEVINGDLDQSARIRVLKRFRQDQIQILVATDVAARGLDIDGISHVFNYDLPREAESYVHRIGRTGRAGKAGIAISLVTPKEHWSMKRIEKFTKKEITQCEVPSDQEIIRKREEFLLERMRMWLNRNRCNKEKELVNGLINEGYDPIDIAASALKLARADETQRPIEQFEKVTAKDHGKKKKSKRGINPSEIVGSIARFSNIPGTSIGKISIKDRHSLVDIEKQYVEKVLAKTGKIKMKKNPVTFKCIEE
jgi:ATP-dependent RNA helicase DeaD